METEESREARVEAIRSRVATLPAPARLSANDLRRLAAELECSEHLRTRGVQRLDSPLAQQARDAGFGRLSARGLTAKSAGLLLCAFGSGPHGTWKAVLADEKAFLDWFKTEPRRKELRFGNHRKHETTPQLRNVFRELIKFIKRFASLPTVAIKTPLADTPEKRFDALMKKVKPDRFGRLGTFDFIDLLVQLRLVDAEPEHCYLTDSTGPRNGAVAVWGTLDDEKLEAAAQALARHLKLSCFVVEDALCNVGKDGESCCGDSNADSCDR